MAGLIQTAPASDARAVAQLKAFDKVFARLASSQERLCTGALVIEGNNAARGYMASGETGAVAAVRVDVWQKQIGRIWLAGAPEGANATLGLSPIDGAEFMTAAVAWLRIWSISIASDIAETSREAIRQSIRLAQAEKLGAPDTATLIRTRHHEAAAGRASAIAATESHAALNFGSWTAARKQPGERFDKVWVSHLDNVGRAAHASAHGLRVPLMQAFHVGGEMLVYPGDRTLAASPANTAHCRCFMVYVRLGR
jgi:Phage Mu protein F like protein